MEDAIHLLARWGNLALETVAILVVLFGSAQAVVAVIRVVAVGEDKGGMRGRHVWLVYALARSSSTSRALAPRCRASA